MTLAEKIGTGAVQCDGSAFDNGVERESAGAGRD